MIRYKKIYILPSRFNHEDFNDDPEVLLDLPQSERTSEFWKRYDRQADTHDNKMTEDLSENLDVLLIFAALFSAINTAFISLTMPGLSPDSLTETNGLLRLLITMADNNTFIPADLSPSFTPSSNSVIVNCLFYASLSCSLLAAVAAMMAKEWLQSFDRTGQTGPLEEQGRFRQRKFNGVQQWHLESIIRSLPNILLLSVIFFFAGVCLFLLPVNKAVAGVVIAFSGGGAILCGVSIVAGATSPLCPYQSAASRALKRTGLLFSPLWWKDLVGAVVDLVVRRLPNLVRKILDTMHNHPRVATAIIQLAYTFLPSTTLANDPPSDQPEVAQAASWLLGTTSNCADQVVAAQFICTLDRTAYVYAFEDSETRRRLVFLTREAFDTWHSRPTETNQQIAELLGLVLCRVLLWPFEHGARRENLTNLRSYQSRSFGGSFLRAFEFASNNYLCYRPEDEEILLHISVLLAITSRSPVIREYSWTGPSRFFLTGQTSHLVDVLLGLWAKFFSDIDPDKGSFNRSDRFTELVDTGGDKTVLARHLSNALISGTRVLSTSSLWGNPQSKLHALHGYTACLQRAAELSFQIPQDELTKMIDSVAGLILAYVDPLTSSNPEASSSESVRVSLEAVLALHAFISPNPCANEMRNSPDARAEQLRIGDLIDAVVHIMVDDSERLATSKRFPRTQPQTLAWVRASALGPVEEVRGVLREVLLQLGQELERELVQVQERQLKLAMERERELEREQELLWGREQDRELELKLVQEREREREREQELALERERALERRLERALERALGGALDGALDGALGGSLDGALDGPHGRLADWLEDRLEDRLKDRLVSKILVQRLQVESSILRILLWVRKRSSGAQLDHSHKHKILISTCRLWAPLETRVDFIINGIKWGINHKRLTVDDGNRDKILTPGDLNAIVEFAEDLQKDREKSEFIARNADVGINRLYVHFNRRVDWNYDLYDLREPRTLCSRSMGMNKGLI